MWVFRHCHWMFMVNLNLNFQPHFLEISRSCTFQNEVSWKIVKKKHCLLSNVFLERKFLIFQLEYGVGKSQRDFYFLN
jgi:hypothetical protein